MNRLKTLSMTLIACLGVLVFVGTAGCLVKEPGYSSVIAKADEAVSFQIKWLDEQKFMAPDPLAPLNITADSVASDTHRIGRGGAEAPPVLNIGAGMGGIGGGDGGGGGGGGGG